MLAGSVTGQPLWGVSEQEAAHLHSVVSILPSEKGHGSLQAAYRLSVRPVPPVPGDLLADPELDEASAVGVYGQPCPVEIRAIVAGSGDAFAIVSNGQEQSLVRAGDHLKSSWGRGRIVSIVANTLVIRHGGVVKNCHFSPLDRGR